MNNINFLAGITLSLGILITFLWFYFKIQKSS
jgi:hypothetical protein